MKKYLFFIITALFLQACSDDKTAQMEKTQTAQQTVDKSQPSGEKWNGSTLS